MHTWCVLPTSIKHVSKQENVSVVLLFKKEIKVTNGQIFCCPTNNIKALKIKIGYSIVTYDADTTQLNSTVGDCRVTVVGTCELAITDIMLIN